MIFLLQRLSGDSRVSEEFRISRAIVVDDDDDDSGVGVIIGAIAGVAFILLIVLIILIILAIM